MTYTTLDIYIKAKTRVNRSNSPLPKLAFWLLFVSLRVILDGVMSPVGNNDPNCRFFGMQEAELPDNEIVP